MYDNYFLRIVGESPLFTSADDGANSPPEPTKIEILIKNVGESMSWVVGISAKDIHFETMLQQLFRIEVSGVAWVEIEEIGSY